MNIQPANVSLNANREFLLLAGGAVVLVLFLGYQAKKAVKETATAVTDTVKDVAKATAEAVNPFEDTNYVYRATNYIGSKITANSKFDLGIWYWDLVND